MKIEIDHTQIVPLDKFELSWRFAKSHNPDILESELNEIFTLSIEESKRVNKIIDFYEIESNRTSNFKQTDWFTANQENKDEIDRFRNNVTEYLNDYNEDIIISWDRRTVLKTSKILFLKYWTDFLYPSSDDVTIISEKTNWIMFYSHYGVANLWIKK